MPKNLDEKESSVEVLETGSVSKREKRGSILVSAIIFIIGGIIYWILNN